MKGKQFSDAMGQLDDKYVSEALHYKKKRERPVWVKWGSLAACFCAILAVGMLTLHQTTDKIPHPERLQVANPIVEVASVEEMKEYLDFSVPVLDKEVETYSVILADDYPTTGQVDYQDGSEYRVQYGSGDISGIYGGVLTDTQEVDNVKVQYYRFDGEESQVTYAIWEEGGYTFSYIYGENGPEEVRSLIQVWADLP